MRQNIKDTMLNVDYFVLGVTVVICLVLLGALAFGAGGEFIASRGLGVGAWGAVRIGSEGMTRIQESCCGAVEGVQGVSDYGLLGGPRDIDKVETSGIWDTAGGQIGLSGSHLTTHGYEGERYHGYGDL